MDKIYITTAGQAWDEIAKEVYGNESYTSFLMSNNLALIEWTKFPANTEVLIKELPKEASTLPDWRS